MPQAFGNLLRSAQGDPPPSSLHLGEVVSALSQALDLGTGSDAWHSVRTCILGMRVAAELKLPEDLQSDLFYALLLKDALTSAGPHANPGLTLATLIRLSEQTAIGIADLHEHWDGYGSLQGLHGEDIPMLSRIMLLAETLDAQCSIAGADAALADVVQKGGSWFDPAVVKAARSLAARAALWLESNVRDPSQIVLPMEPRPHTLAERDVTLEAVCQAFVTIVDAKSPFTYDHSNRVAKVAAAMAAKLGLDRSHTLFVRHAALVHDLGKMAVSNTILQKAGRLSPAEWGVMRSHPEHTWRILHSVHGLEQMSEVAASHHEKLDGSGYFRGLSAEQLPLESRILAIADVFDALSTKRPYREPMSPENAFAFLRQQSPDAFDAACIEALEQSDLDCDQGFQTIYALQQQLSPADDLATSHASPLRLP